MPAELLLVRACRSEAQDKRCMVCFRATAGRVRTPETFSGGKLGYREMEVSDSSSTQYQPWRQVRSTATEYVRR